MSTLTFNNLHAHFAGACIAQPDAVRARMDELECAVDDIVGDDEAVSRICRRALSGVQLRVACAGHYENLLLDHLEGIAPPSDEEALRITDRLALEVVDILRGRVLREEGEHLAAGHGNWKATKRDLRARLLAFDQIEQSSERLRRLRPAAAQTSEIPKPVCRGASESIAPIAAIAPKEMEVAQ